MQDLVDKLAEVLIAKNMMIVTAESCTGGLLASALTQKPGASAYYDRGFITYSNEAKQEQLGVPVSTITQHGAVSSQTAKAMAKGALENSKADIAISITGIAGPDGGTAEKPLGTVYFGYAIKGSKAKHVHHIFKGDRSSIQSQATETALKTLITLLDE